MVGSVSGSLMLDLPIKQDLTVNPLSSMRAACALLSCSSHSELQCWSYSLGPRTSLRLLGADPKTELSELQGFLCTVSSKSQPSSPSHSVDEDMICRKW